MNAEYVHHRRIAHSANFFDGLRADEVFGAFLAKAIITSFFVVACFFGLS